MPTDSNPSISNLIDRLASMPFVAAFATTRSNPNPNSDSNSNSDHPDPESTNHDHLDRIILINPLTQSMVVIAGTSTQFDSLFNDFVTKEGQPPASQASIDDLPVTEVKSEEEIERLDGECAICLEEWAIGDVVKQMPCKHRFHGGCVDRWLKSHGSCPICRRTLPVDDLGEKIGGEGRRIRREIWLSFAFGEGRLASEEESLD